MKKKQYERKIETNKCLMPLFTSIIAIVISVLPSFAWCEMTKIALLILLAISIIILAYNIDKNDKNIDSISLLIEYISIKKN